MRGVLGGRFVHIDRGGFTSGGVGGSGRAVGERQGTGVGGWGCRAVAGKELALVLPPWSCGSTGARCGRAKDAGRQAQAAAECQGAHRCQRRAAGDHRKLHAHQQCARSGWHCLTLPWFRRHAAEACTAQRTCYLRGLSRRCARPRLSRPLALVASRKGRLNPCRCCTAVGHFRVKIGMLDPPRVVIRDMVRCNAAAILSRSLSCDSRARAALTLPISWRAETLRFERTGRSRWCAS